MSERQSVQPEEIVNEKQGVFAQIVEGLRDKKEEVKYWFRVGATAAVIGGAAIAGIASIDNEPVNANTGAEQGDPCDPVMDPECVTPTTFDNKGTTTTTEGTTTTTEGTTTTTEAPTTTTSSTSTTSTSTTSTTAPTTSTTTPTSTPPTSEVPPSTQPPSVTIPAETR